MPLEQALDVAIQLADALGRAHGNGVVHRDVSPANVMLTKSGAKLLDFGLATLVAPEPGQDPSRIRTHLDPLRHRLIGTPYYMSPEQAKGQPADRRSDIFSMGVLLYEMVTGRRPFEGSNLVSVLASILRDPHAPVTRLNPALPVQLGPIVDKCLEKDPARRWQSVSQLQHRLESLRADLQSAVRASHRSIAVLPFSDMSEARDQGYLCEGIAEEILFALSRVKGLRVASRASAFRYRAAGADPAEIGSALQVTTLLDGTVRRAGDRIRITVTLVAVDDGFCLWSERYDRDVHDIFALQDEIARAVVNALEITLSTADREAAHRLSTPDLDAYECYLRGRSYFFRFDKRSVGYARELFEQAITIDPSVRPRVCRDLRLQRVPLHERGAESRGPRARDAGRRGRPEGRARDGRRPLVARHGPVDAGPPRGSGGRVPAGDRAQPEPLRGALLLRPRRVHPGQARPRHPRVPRKPAASGPRTTSRRCSSPRATKTSGTPISRRCAASAASPSPRPT